MPPLRPSDSRALTIVMSAEMFHNATERSEMSITEGSPVRSRLKSALVMPPAIVMPPMLSPNAGRWPTGGPSWPAPVIAEATPPRAQYEAPS